MLHTYLEQAPKILARESLRNVEAVALGSGQLKRGQAQSAIRVLERRASGRVGQRARSVSSLDEARAVYAGMGIGVEVVSASAGAEGATDAG